ncbi:hypothetical protein [Chroogloeocystis siderophila]|nr:hypothetical protein [Chroogloeocystis siderophila]
MDLAQLFLLQLQKAKNLMATLIHAVPIVSSRALGWKPLIAEEFQQP